MADNIIELRHISKVYSDNGFKAVDDFNLEVKRGEFVYSLKSIITIYFTNMS